MTWVTFGVRKCPGGKSVRGKCQMSGVGKVRGGNVKCLGKEKSNVWGGKSPGGKCQKSEVGKVRVGNF